MKLNKKGFTLVELLAVVVILAVIMLVAVTAIGPVIENSKKSAFFSTVAGISDSVDLAFATGKLTAGEGCNVTVADLVSKGYLKNNDQNLKGIVKIKKVGQGFKYYFYVTNGVYMTNKVSSLENAIDLQNMTKEGANMVVYSETNFSMDGLTTTCALN